MVHPPRSPPDNAVTSEVMPSRTKVPKGYLSKILRDLVVAEMVVSQRGRRLYRCPPVPPDLHPRRGQRRRSDRRIKKRPNPAHVQLCPLHRRLDDAMAMAET